MRHDISLQGHAFVLRPLAEADAAFVTGLRTAASRFLNRGAETVHAQRAWIESYLERADDFTFVVQRTGSGESEGMAGIYAVDHEREEGEWGRFVLREGSLAAIETALLIYRVAFERLRLRRVRCRTLAGNAQVVAFHDSCGLLRCAAPVPIEHDGSPALAIEHVLDVDRWPAVYRQLDRLAERTARHVAGSVA